MSLITSKKMAKMMVMMFWEQMREYSSNRIIINNKNICMRKYPKIV